MLFETPFYQLPLHFDAERLQAEALAFEATEWVQHPTGFSGNAALILVSVGGGINDDFAISGPMQPTPQLERSPYIRQVLSALKLPISRTRLMRIAAGGEVPRHRDINYHWYRRVRLHIPVVTDPAVRFQCGEAEVHMAAGELWAFDHTQPHQVINPSDADRIHLVVDVRRDAGLEAYLKRARTPALSARAIFPVFPEQVPFIPDQYAPVRCEPYRFEVLTATEMQQVVEVLREDLNNRGNGTAGRLGALAQIAADWTETFAQYGHDRAGEFAYALLIRQLEKSIAPDALSPAARDAYYVVTAMLKTTNRTWRPYHEQTPKPKQKQRQVVLDVQRAYQMTPRAQATLASLPVAFQQLLEVCEEAETLHQAGQRAEAKYGMVPAAFQKRVQQLLAMQLLEAVPLLPRIERPVFIVSAPRAGSTLLFETLAQTPEAWTIGGESHLVLESIPTLHPAHRTYQSNRLTAEDATPAVAEALRQQLARRLVDRSGQTLAERLAHTHSVRWLEKTPKNALRIPFLRALFPDARFIYLHRDPAASLASIMAGWRSQQFVTYPDLPGWDTLRWSFLLPEGWEAYRQSATLADVAAFQWRSANRQIIEDLAALPASDWYSVAYQELVDDPQTTIQRLCTFADFTLDGVLLERLAAPLPWSRYTLSAPAADKWRMDEAAIAAQLPHLVDLVEDIQALS